MKHIKINLTEQEVQELSSGESLFITIGDTRAEIFQGEEPEHEDYPPKTDEEIEFNRNAMLGINPLKRND